MRKNYKTRLPILFSWAPSNINECISISVISVVTPPYLLSIITPPYLLSVITPPYLLSVITPPYLLTGSCLLSFSLRKGLRLILPPSVLPSYNYNPFTRTNANLNKVQVYKIESARTMMAQHLSRVITTVQ